jgi:predicted transcriptional regulator
MNTNTRRRNGANDAPPGERQMWVVDDVAADVVSARPERSLKQAARVMVDAGVSWLPVIGDTGMAVGIIAWRAS